MKSLIILTILLSGCSAISCIKVGGEHKELQGDIEICFDEKESKESGLTTVKQDGETARILTDTELEIVLSKIPEIRAAGHQKEAVSVRLKGILKGK